MKADHPEPPEPPCFASARLGGRAVLLDYTVQYSAIATVVPYAAMVAAPWRGVSGRGASPTVVRDIPRRLGRTRTGGTGYVQ